MPKKDEVWVTRDGRRIPVGELTEDHAKDILRMILKNKRRRIKLQRALYALPDMYEEDQKWGNS